MEDWGAVMTTKQEDILARVFVWTLIIVFSILLWNTFCIVTYRVMYRWQVYQTVYKVLDKEMVLLKQHSHKGVPLGGGE